MLEAVEKKLEAVEKKLEAVEKKLKAVEETLVVITYPYTLPDTSHFILVPCCKQPTSQEHEKESLYRLPKLCVY